MSSILSIDESSFLNSLEDFKRCLLPGINAKRAASGLPDLTEQEAIDEYLDRINAARAQE